MSGEKILIIEDEKDLVKVLKYNLQKEGYLVISSYDGADGLERFRKEKPDLVILDLMLPKMDGYEFCKIVRGESQAPIIMLTAKKEEADRVIGLEIGADDYITKPFSVRELLARIKTILRRREVKTDKTVLRAGGIEMDLDTYEVHVKGKRTALSSKEFELLKHLLSARGKVITREQLLERVWGVNESMEIETRTVDQHVARLRKRMGKEAERILTIKNVGYRLKTDNV